MERREPFAADQVRKRILNISHADFWPGITPFNVGDLEYGTWLSLALSCDQQIESARKAQAEAERARKNKGR